MNKGTKIVTSLERSAMAHLKGGAASNRSQCPSTGWCSGSVKSAMGEAYKIQKSNSGTVVAER